MAQKEHVYIVGLGTVAWNEWRVKHPDIQPDLSEADLSWADLSRADLSRANLRDAILSDAILSGADLRGANLLRADLRGAELSGADLSRAELSDAILNGADLNGADLRDANLIWANLSEADLREADLREADLRDANLSGAYLSGADLSGADLRDANLSGAYLSGANLSGADLSGANLEKASLKSVRLQSAKLDGATLTGATIWETQRAMWSIKGVKCETVFWDEARKEIIRYAPGEFERLYSEQPRIELFYKDGLTKFELNTLPALLQHLATLHPNCTIRLKSIHETGGGAAVSISVEDADSQTVEAMKVELVQLQADFARLEGANQQLEKLIDKFTSKMIAAAKRPHIQITGGTNVIGTDRAYVNAQQHINDLSAIQPLLNEVVARRRELSLTPDQATQLEQAVRDVQTELQKAQPRYPVISKGLQMVCDFVVQATGGAAGAALADHWNPLVNQLTHFLHLVTSRLPMP